MASVSAQITSQLQAGVEVISNTLCLGPDWLLQGKLAFINLDEATLMSDFVCLLPSHHVVYEILETVPVTPVLIARIQELKQLGYRFALDDFVCLEEYRPLLPMVDFVKLDVLEQHPEKTVEIIAHIQRDFTGQFIAEKVETREMFELCRSCGIQYFQGYYFARPENLANKAIQPGQVAVLELMNKVRTCEDLSEIEEPLRRNAALTIRLLRYANSAASGLQQKVHTVRQALTQIGLMTLYRWLALLLVTANPIANQCPAGTHRRHPRAPLRTARPIPVEPSGPGRFIHDRTVFPGRTADGHPPRLSARTPAHARAHRSGPGPPGRSLCTLPQTCRGFRAR